MIHPTLKRTLWLFIPALAVILGCSALIYWLTLSKVEGVAKANGRQTVAKAEQLIADELSVALKDLTYLSFVHESHEIFDQDINQDLKDTFMSIIYNRKNYDQIRYIAPDGRESFRINYNHGSPLIILPQNLQDKKHRYYFDQAINLDLDEIYMSPLDLNMEHGTIEVPYKPMLRIASPIPNADGQTVGIMLINILGNSLFRTLQDLDDDICCDLLLLNEQGYTLKGPDMAQEWGFMFLNGDKPSIIENEPGIWQTMSNSDHGQFMSEGRVVTYDTVDMAEHITLATQLEGNHIAPTWRLLTISPPVHHSAELSALLHRMLLIDFPLILIVALFSYRQASLRTKNKQAEATIRRQLESNARFVPNEFLGLLRKGELTDVHISDNVQRPMTTMFTDIRSYTKISEGMTPQQVLEFLNKYYGVLDPEITRNNGFIDAFIGDAVMALFPGDPEDALKAVIGIRKALKHFQHTNGVGETMTVESGFGMHLGEVTLGAVGTEHRLQTTAIGDAVNLASRIESATKLYGVSVIITGAVKEALPAPDLFHMRSIDLVRVKGKQEVVELFEVFDTDPEELLQAKTVNLGLFTIAMAQYRRGEFEQALGSFTQLKENCPNDTVLDIFIKKSNTMMRIPPGDGWTGVSTM